MIEWSRRSPMRSMTRSGGGSIESIVGGQRVVPLADEYGREFARQARFHRGEQIRLVVDHHVMRGRIAPLHVVEHAPCAVDQHAALDRSPRCRSAGSCAAGTRRRRPTARPVRPSCERCAIGSSAPGKQQLRERVFEHEFRHLQQLGSVVEPGAKRLQAGQVVGAPQLLAQRREDPNSACAGSAPNALSECASLRSAAKRSLSSSVLSTSSRNTMPAAGSLSTAGLLGARIVPAGRAAMMRALAAGPQLPGSYSSTGSGIRLAASDRRRATPPRRVILREQRRVAVDRIAQQALVRRLLDARVVARDQLDRLAVHLLAAALDQRAGADHHLGAQAQAKIIGARALLRIEDRERRRSSD
jgi:hypothetical protein